MRPWEPMGMTTADWLFINPSRVLVDSLKPSQEHLEYDALVNETPSYCGDDLPHCVLWAGDLYVSDGHHRIARAKVRGDSTIYVRVAVPFEHFHPT